MAVKEAKVCALLSAVLVKQETNFCGTEKYLKLIGTVNAAVAATVNASANKNSFKLVQNNLRLLQTSAGLRLYGGLLRFPTKQQNNVIYLSQC